MGKAAVTFARSGGGWGGETQGARRLYVRRGTWPRPRAEAVAVVTDSPDAGRSPAADLRAVCRTRWQIESVCHQVTGVFHRQRLIGCRPPATVFQASLCPVLSNVLQLVRGPTTAGRPEPTAVEAVSGGPVFADLARELVGRRAVLTVEEVIGGVAVPDGAEGVRTRLRVLRGGPWSPKWVKVRNKKPRPGKPRPRQSGAHTSVHRRLRAAARTHDPPPEQQP